MTEPKKERTFLAVLSDHQLKYLFNLLGGWIGFDNHQKKAIAAALLKVESTGRMDYNVETNIHVFIPTEKSWQYEFTEKELVGVKLAIIQDIAGLPQQRFPATEGTFRYYITPLLKAFGERFKTLVLKEARPKEEPADDFTLDLDEEVAAPAKEESKS